MFSQQQQSPLFQLPREIRDQIYLHCAHDDKGYHHAFDMKGTGNLYLSSDYMVHIPLKSTCKKVAAEIRGIGIQANTIHFYPSDYQFNPKTAPTGSLLDQEIPSAALRYKRLTEMANITKWRMLVRCAKVCISRKMLAKIDGDFPGHDFSVLCRRAVIDVPIAGLDHGFISWHNRHEKWSGTGQHALEACLRMASSHPQFEQLAAGACDQDTTEDAFGKRTFFKNGSHMEVLKWNPVPWHIPTLAELDYMESLLVDTEDMDLFLKEKNWDRWQWRFSACAVAIHALQRLSSGVRANLRHIVLHEDTTEVSLHWSHAQGLLPILGENPRLQVERWVRGYLCVFHSRWEDVHPIQYSGPSAYNGAYHLASMVAWLDEARQMSLRHTSKRSYVTIFKEDGDSEIFTFLDKARQMKDSMLYCLQQGSLHRTPKASGPGDWRNAFLVPWDLPNWFSGLVDNLGGDASSIVRYEGQFAKKDIPVGFNGGLDRSLVEWLEQWDRLMLAPVQLEHLYSGRLRTTYPYANWERELLENQSLD